MKDTYREERADDRRDYNRKLRNISDAYRKAGSDQKFIMTERCENKEECEKHY